MIGSEDLPQMVYLILLLVFLASSVLFNRQIKASKVLGQLLIWMVIILVILFIYSFRFDFSNFKNRIAGELFPTKITQINSSQIAVSIANDGHFYIDIKLNSKPVRFMVDTGASDISLSLSDAKKVGIDTDNLTSFRRYQTANGLIMSGLARVDQMEVAGIIFNDVGVAVNGGDMGTSLLGMSFLSRFDKYEFYEDRLILTLN
ncbi:MAG: aspartyl protease family protein [Myxococcota bacterium]|jgi:aspartyl protease family protein